MGFKADTKADRRRCEAEREDEVRMVQRHAGAETNENRRQRGILVLSDSDQDEST